MGTDRGFRWDGTLAQEFIDLPDGTRVTKNYDKTGIRTIEERYYRVDGTLQMKKQYNEKGQWIITKYDETGKNPITNTQPNNEVRDHSKTKEDKMLGLKEPEKTFRSDGTLSHEMVELPDGTEVNITYDETGTKVLEKKEIPPYTEHISKDGKCITRHRKDGTLWLVRQCNENGFWKVTEYDKMGKTPVCTVFESKPFKDEVADLVASAELLSKKRHKNRMSSFQKQKGE